MRPGYPSVVREELFDKKAGGGVEALAIGPLGYREDLLRGDELQMPGEETHVVLVLTNAVSQNLERKELLGRGDEDSEARKVKNRRCGGVLTLEKALDGIV